MCFQARLLLKWAAKVTVKELLTRIFITSLGEVPVPFSSGRKVFYLYCALPLDQFGTLCSFPRGGKSSVWIICRRSTSLERRAFFSGRKNISDCLSSHNWTSTRLVWFPAARRIWNVVLFSQGKIFFYLYCLSSLYEFGTSCRFPQGGNWLCLPLTARLNVVLISRHSTIWNVVLFSSERREFVCESSLNWTSCLIYNCSTSLVSRAVFTGRKFVYLCCCDCLMSLGRHV